jgi:threonine aldolase
MIFFSSDYSQGAHPEVLAALARTNLEHTDGYGLDPHCENAADTVRSLIGDDTASVHFMVGGTPCNVTFAAAVLKPFQSVIAAHTGHIYFHETGALEGTGHRIVTVEAPEGKLTPELIELALEEYQDEHTPKPGLVYISQPTELGTLYKKAELEAISRKCREHGLIFYIDGARLGAALTCRENDASIRDIAALCDAFYIGGTKNGALFGEALVIKNTIDDGSFRHMIKRQCGLLAKGRLLGVQFEALLDGGEESLLYRIGRHENEMAELLREGLEKLGVGFIGNSRTNQLFPILPAEAVRELKRDFFFYEWRREKDGMIPIRLVTSWGTQRSDVEEFLMRLGELLRACPEA